MGMAIPDRANDTPENVLTVCTAYEQGYGKGQDSRNCKNPYRHKADEWWAWDYGYSEGYRKRTKT